MRAKIMSLSKPLRESVSSVQRVQQTHREALIERFFQLQKDRRELKRRNGQAQTNIAQYFRKHKLTP